MNKDRELLERVLYRLYEDDDLAPEPDWELLRRLPPLPFKALAKDCYDSAKRSTRDGNLKPLGKLLSAITGDPDIVAFLAVPRRKRGQRRYKGFFFERYDRSRVIETVRKIRQILRDETGKAYRRRGEDFGRGNRQ